MSQMESSFFIKTIDKPIALKAIKDFVASKERISWAYKSEIENARTLEDALEEFRWFPENDEEDNIDSIYFQGEKSGDDDLLFNAIAPYVRAGSYIQMCGEDGTIWRFTFDGEIHEEIYAELVFK